MKKILILGAGQSTPYLVTHLLEQAQEMNWFVTLGDRHLSLARKRLAKHPCSTAVHFDVTDAEKGEPVYRERLDLDGNLYSSVVAAAGEYVFLSSTRGETIVLEAGREYREKARNKLESFGSNPVFVGKRMYVRAHKNLYCIGD